MNSFNRNAIDWFVSIMCTIRSCVCVYTNYRRSRSCDTTVFANFCVSVMRAIRRHFNGMCNKWKKLWRVSMFLICLLAALLARSLSHPFGLFHTPFASDTLSLVRLLAHSRIKGSSFRFDSIWNIDTAKKCCCLVKWGTNDLSNILRVFGAFGRVKYWPERYTHRERARERGKIQRSDSTELWFRKPLTHKYRRYHFIKNASEQFVHHWAHSSKTWR